MDERQKLRDTVRHYRELAAEAEQMAGGSMLPTKFREAYHKMARHWTALACDLEGSLTVSERRLN